MSAKSFLSNRISRQGQEAAVAEEQLQKAAAWWREKENALRKTSWQETILDERWLRWVLESESIEWQKVSLFSFRSVQTAFQPQQVWLSTIARKPTWAADATEELVLCSTYLNSIVNGIGILCLNQRFPV